MQFLSTARSLTAAFTTRQEGGDYMETPRQEEQQFEGGAFERNVASLLSVLAA